jgi:hypothetical protein
MQDMKLATAQSIGKAGLTCREVAVMPKLLGAKPA